MLGAYGVAGLARRGGPHPLDRVSSQLRWNPVYDSSCFVCWLSSSPSLPSGSEQHSQWFGWQELRPRAIFAGTPGHRLLRRSRLEPSDRLRPVIRPLENLHRLGSRSSVEKPRSDSRHLHAGHRLGSLQGNPQTSPDGITLRRFRCHVLVHDESTVVHLRSSSDPHLPSHARRVPNAHDHHS